MMKTRTIAALAALSLLLLGACKKKQIPPPFSESNNAPMGSAPQASGDPGGQAGIAGPVVEKLDVDKYSYLRIKSAGGLVWAAVPRGSVKKGQRVAVSGGVWMRNFRSKELNRTFTRVLFGQLAAAPTRPRSHAAGTPGHGGGMQGHKRPPVKRAALASPLAKAPGPNGRTVGEIFATRKALAGKEIALRARVVKFTPQIMGKNWVHLQDGTGNESDYDLTVTTSDTVAVGDTVIAKGVVSVDKNFGLGYAYRVILEQARLTKE